MGRRAGILLVALSVALAGCEEDSERIAVLATEIGGGRVRVSVRNDTDRDVSIAACPGGDIYALLERRVVDPQAGASWTFVSYPNENCDVTGDTGIGLAPGAELEFTASTPPHPARYRIVVFRMLDFETDPELEWIPSNPFDT